MFTVTWQQWNKDRDRWEFRHAETETWHEAEVLLDHLFDTLPADEISTDDDAIRKGD